MKNLFFDTNTEASVGADKQAADMEAAWNKFVADSKDDGRNPNMVTLFLRWLRCSDMKEDLMVDEAYRRYCAEWPDSADEDAEEQLWRAADKAIEIYSEDNAMSDKIQSLPASVVKIRCRGHLSLQRYWRRQGVLERRSVWRTWCLSSVTRQ